jgi:hypothetical protein
MMRLERATKGMDISCHPWLSLSKCLVNSFSKGMHMQSDLDLSPDDITAQRQWLESIFSVPLESGCCRIDSCKVQQCIKIFAETFAPVTSASGNDAQLCPVCKKGILTIKSVKNYRKMFISCDLCLYVTSKPI